MSQSIQRPFPFCPVASASVGTGTLFPFATDLVGTIDLYRKIKLWQIEIETTWATYLFSDLQFSRDGLGTDAATSEFDLACAILQGDFTHYDIAGEFLGTPPPEITIRFEALIFSEFCDPAIVPVSKPADPDAEPDALRSDSGSYYPQCFLAVTAFNDSVTGVTNDASTYDDGTATSAPTTCFINGHAAAMYSYNNSDIVSVVLAPQEYWPYAPTSGGAAVYDTATGVLIPPNVVVD